MFHLKNDLADQTPIISHASIDTMKTASDPRRPPNTNYALGWGVYYMNGYKVVSHGGGGPGIDAQLVLIPSKDVAIAVLANSRAGSSSSVSNMIANKMLPLFSVEDVWKQISSVFSPSPNRSRTKPTAYAGEWEGDIKSYASNIPIHLVINRDGSARLRRMDNVSNAEHWTSATNGIRFSNGFLDMWFNEGIVLLDPERPEDYLRLIVQGVDGRLRGSASAGCDVLGPGRSITYLPSCVELTTIE